MHTPLVEMLASDHRAQLLGEADHDAFVRHSRGERRRRADSRRRVRALITWGVALPRYAFRHSSLSGLRASADEGGGRARRGPLDAGGQPAAGGLTHP
jgi:hypothetical protein